MKEPTTFIPWSLRYVKHLSISSSIFIFSFLYSFNFISSIVLIFNFVFISKYFLFNSFMFLISFSLFIISETILSISSLNFIIWVSSFFKYCNISSLVLFLLFVTVSKLSIYTSVTPTSFQILRNLSYSSANSLSASYIICLFLWYNILLFCDTLLEFNAIFG